jgi:hypothetical protein
MLPSNQARVSVVVLALSLVLNFILVSCAAEATAPQPADNTEVLAKLDAVMARLTAIEGKFDPQTTALNNRIDSLGRVLLAADTSADTMVVAVGEGQIAKLDSIIAIASYIANEQATGGTEACIGLSAKGELKVGPEAEAKGEGAADGGAWAGTGAYAGAKLSGKLDVSYEGSLELPMGVEYCAPLFGDSPPIRAVPASVSAPSLPSQRTALIDAVTQLGITDTRLMSSMGVLATAFQSPASFRLQDVGTILPLPGGLAGIVSDPMGALTATLPAKMDEAMSSLCTANWGPRVAGPISTACARINGGPLDISGLFSMMEEFPAVQTAITTVNTGLTNVTNRLTTVCGRVNTVGVTSLTIPNPLSIGPDPLFGPQRLFPNFTNISCLGHGLGIGIGIGKEWARLRRALFI